MDVHAELRLSFYRDIAMLNQDHGVSLVQHIETNMVYVKKELALYDLRVFQFLMDNPLPGIPKIQELVESDGRLYVIEEYISGRSLRDRLDSDGPLPVATALSYLRQLCDILRPLHQLSPPVVHRDIKPSNIVITSVDQLYLVDFNSAKETSHSREQDTVLIGTFGYAAPEQYGFSPSQPTADIYALGVLLNEMLTGKKPQEKMCSAPLATVVKRCLQMEPSNRYQTVDQLLQDVAGKRPPFSSAGAKIQSWLPPGFRSRQPLRWVFAALWYAFIVLLSCEIVIDGAGPVKLTILRIFFFLLFLAETLWVGNYRNLWAQLPLTSHSKRAYRILGAVCWAVVLFFASMLVMAIFTQNL